ncbi:type VI secretion system lipoprotein TssJ [Halomonas sp. MCCC 1A11036]|uniref:Type VI secretion system lipoprotein TssJ n=1 Tax=Billgrantia zhangzhouensis TaxID=2733481 RepID=A0ABS9A9A7_9GAMM|nr:type VI secretion system lipoprotein TssJ [Halomonas zhangzhouensis]MCE8018510.1 type VI secretion system lipoprotein TssJ [Halomonas zhangzhouensis]
MKHGERNSRWLWAGVALLLAIASLLGGCGVGGRIGNQFDGAVGDILFNRDERVTVALEGDERLNPDAEDASLSVVVRIYQLSSLTAFSAAAAAELWHDAGAVLGDALISEREVVVLPGGQAMDSAPMAQPTAYVAVAAFFRQIPDERWRLVFDAAAMRKDGILTSPGGVTVNLVENRIEPTRRSARLLASTNND